MVMNRGHALARDELIRVLTAYTGVTTADGAVDGTTLIDSNLIGRNDFVTGKTILIGSGNARDEDAGAIAFDNTTGQITLLGTGFNSQILAGTIFRIINISSVETLIGYLSDALVSYVGITTADGAPAGASLICAGLVAQPDFDGNEVVILSGPYKGQARDITGITTGGTVTPLLNFGGLITSGIAFAILAIRTTPAEVAAIEAKLDHASHGLAALKVLIDAVEGKLDAMLVLTETGGTIIATGAEQDVYINDAPAGEFEPRKVVIDLSDLAAAETAIIRTYYRIKDGGAKGLKGEVIFNGVQPKPMKNIELEPNRFGIAVTIEATAGVVVDWEVHYEV